MNYNCKICDYSTNIKTHFKKHLETNKHRKNLLKLTLKNDSTKIFLIDSVEVNPKEPKMNPKEPKMNPKEPGLNPKEPGLNPKEPGLNPKYHIIKKKVYFCDFCYKQFSTNSHMNRHISHNCAVKKEQELKENTKDKKEIAELKNQIQTLIGKVSTKSSHNNTHIGDTTINTINLNVFGKENLDMITDEVKKEMIKGPFKMMPKLLEMIYFNNKYPENHTMKLVNKNKELMKVHKKKGWEFVDKQDTIDYLLEDKNYTLDSFFDTNPEIFSKMIKKTYENFRRLFDNRDKELWKLIKKDVDLLLWNNM